MIGAEYYFNGNVRLNAGFASPNYAGAFFAAVYPYLLLAPDLTSKYFSFRARRLIWVKLLGVTSEFVCYWCVAATYSRGSLVALIGCLFWWTAIHMKARTQAKPIIQLLFRLVILALFIILNGFIHRTAPNYIVNDHSILNRLELWRSGLAMIGSCPWGGWGDGQSGMVFTNWYSSPNNTYQYATLVNSFLTLVTEHGFIALLLLSFLLLFTFYGTSKILLHIPSFPWAAASSTAIFSLCISNAFSTLYNSIVLAIIAILSIIILVICIGLSSQLKRIAITAAIASLFSSLVVVAATRGALQDRVFQIALDDHNTIVIEKLGAANNSNYPSSNLKSWTLWIDQAVLGKIPGKSIRKFLELSPAGTRFNIRSGGNPSRTPQPNESVVVFGVHAARICTYTPLSTSLIIVNPDGKPPRDCPLPKNCFLILPFLDEQGTNNAWSEWALRNSCSISYTRFSGKDIRSEDMSIIARFFNS